MKNFEVRNLFFENILLRKTSMQALLIFINLLIFLSSFGGVAYFLWKTDFSLTSLESLLPATGALAFAGFFVFKAVLSSDPFIKEDFGYVNIIIDNQNRMVMYPALDNSLNPSITRHTFYMSSIIAMQGYFSSHLQSVATDDDILDGVEYGFIEKLLHGWILKGDEAFLLDSISADTILNSALSNKILSFSQNDLQALNNRVGHQYSSQTFRDYLSSSKLALPKGTKFQRSTNEMSRKLFFTNDVMKIQFTIATGGVSNFRPEYNRFHQYLSRSAQTPQHSSYLSMKKTFIFYKFELAPLAKYRDDYSDYENLDKSIRENLSSQIYFEPLLKTLETEYLLAK